jgi:hypothetical protein
MAVKPDDYYKSPLNIFLDIKKEDIMPRASIPRMEIITEE